MYWRLLVCIATTLLISETLSKDFVVNTKYGNVRGTTSFSNTGVPIKVWRGIPFAQPPVGNLRFASPIEPEEWRPNTLDCSVRHLTMCPQLTSVLGEVVGQEDCLYLDIYAPASADQKSALPVMVWMYGGGYVLGDKYEFGLYEASNVVAAHNNYIHVAMNYRLSSLGFLALQGLKDESPYNSTGNYALQDQRMALKFVQENIQAFGGDPNKVTIFGESAGAFSVCWHLVSPMSRGLFRAAIMESGNCEADAFYFEESKSIAWGNTYAQNLGCDSLVMGQKEVLECLRKLPLAEVIHGGGLKRNVQVDGDDTLPLLYPFMPWGATIDRSIYGLMDLPWNLIKKGNFSKVPVVIGTNANEGNIFLPAIPFVTHVLFPLNKDSTAKAMSHFFNATTVQKLISIYTNRGTTWEDVVSLIIRDYIFACPARRVAREISLQGGQSFLYHFTFAAPNWIDQWILGDYHSSELEFVFNNPWPPLIHYFDEQDKKMASYFGGYWNNLAISGVSPNQGPNQLPNWPNYQAKAPAILNFNIPLVVEHEYLDDICDFWDTVTITN